MHPYHELLITEALFFHMSHPKTYGIAACSLSKSFANKVRLGFDSQIRLIPPFVVMCFIFTLTPGLYHSMCIKHEASPPQLPLLTFSGCLLPICPAFGLWTLACVTQREIQVLQQRQLLKLTTWDLEPAIKWGTWEEGWFSDKGQAQARSCSWVQEVNWIQHNFASSHLVWV